MKKLISIFCLLLALCLVLTGCGGGIGGNKSLTTFGNEKYEVPSKIYTEEEYQSQFRELLKTENLSTADEAFMGKLDSLTLTLKNRILYNTDDIKDTAGNTYYLSENGDDNNDGKSPRTAWKTLDKLNANISKLGKDSLVLFERGSTFRGCVFPVSDVSFSAYGEGPKPVIAAATKAADKGNWVQTDTKNVWKLDARISQSDVGFLLLITNDGKEICANKQVKMSKLKKNYDFVFAGKTLEEGKSDMGIYLYYDGGNPSEAFESIEIPMHSAIFVNQNGIQNVTINNLDLRYGTDPFWPAYSKNIVISYTTVRWSGGFADGKGMTRYHGGGGAWHSCDTMIWDHCYLYEQYDSGVSPQYVGTGDKEPSVFKDFITKNCIFEACEWTLEYYTKQDDSLENRFENLYFGYNICIRGGDGFGTKASTSSYVKSWGHENTCYNSKIEYNIFDRSKGMTLEIIGHEQSAAGNTLSFDRIPKLSNNIYIQVANKNFAKINDLTFKYTKSDLSKYLSGTFDTGSICLFAEN